MNDFCKDAIEAHKEVVNASEWLSDASKKRLCEKLDAIDVQAVYPEAWEDYSGLELEGLSYYEARRAIWLFDVARNTALTGTKPDARLWVAGGPTLVGSAHYDGNTDSDTVCSSIAYANLLKQLGYDARPVVLGDVNSETQYLLKEAGFEIPERIEDVSGANMILVEHSEYEHEW